MTADIDIVVIDDNEHQLNFLEEFLKRNGYTTRIIEDSREALSEIQAVHPRLIILDVLMPGVDGFTILKGLKSAKSMASIPVIVYSGKTYEVDKRRALSLGADIFLPKPIKGSELLNAIKRYI